MSRITIATSLLMNRPAQGDLSPMALKGLYHNAEVTRTKSLVTYGRLSLPEVRPLIIGVKYFSKDSIVSQFGSSCPCAAYH